MNKVLGMRLFKDGEIELKYLTENEQKEITLEIIKKEKEIKERINEYILETSIEEFKRNKKYLKEFDEGKDVKK